MACDPMPSPYDERDLTSFITQWSEGEDKTLEQAIRNCQIAENIVREMQNIAGEARAMFNGSKLDWCREYTTQLRKIEASKFDAITAHTLMFMEQYTRLTKEEIDKIKESGKTRGKGDLTLRDKLENLMETTDDLFFGIWANVQGKTMVHQKVKFGNYQAGLPMKQTSCPVIFRAMWTSYDYLSDDMIQDDFVVGGIIDFQMYVYPESCRQANSKFQSVSPCRVDHAQRVARQRTPQEDPLPRPYPQHR